MVRIKKIFLLSVLVFACLQGMCQEKFSLRMKWDAKDTALFRQAFPVPATFVTASARETALSDLMFRLAAASYLTAYYDSLSSDSFSLSVLIHPGPVHSWAKLHQGNVSEEALSFAGLRLQLMQGKKFAPHEVSSLMEKLLRYYENNGYPFARLGLDSVQVQESGIVARLAVEKGKQITIDSLEIVGEVSLKQSYLRNYLHIRPGDLYNEELIAGFDAMLADLPFLQVTRPTTVYFIENKARLVFYLKNKKSDQVDGVIGFAPNSENNGDKLLLTGEFHLRLQNLGGTGKLLDVNWRSFLQRSQELKLRFTWPYLLNTRLGADVHFNLLKFDTLFLNLNPQAGLQYQLKGNSYIQASYSLQQTNLLTVDTNYIRANKAFPQISPLKTNLYGLGLHYEKLDYRINPRKGFIIDLNGAVGRRVITRNTTIEKVKFYNDDRPEGYTLYDSVPLRVMQYRFSYLLTGFLPLFKRCALVPGVNGGHLIAPQVFYNELYRIGGVKSLRGFDEQSIYASQYVIANLEFRYLFQQNAYAQVFGNMAWVKRDISGLPSFTDTPFGFGVGLSLETGTGILNLAYALGSQQGNPVELRTGKVHIGLVSYF